MNDTKYNGWTNYETWNVKLWMDNDEGSYQYYNDVAHNALHMASSTDYMTKEQSAAIDLAAVIKSDFEEASPLGDDASTFSDLLGAALSNVNWNEIASHLIDDVLEDAA